MDVQMAGVDGIAATAGVRAASPGTRVLIVNTFARPGYVRSALDAGASGSIVKDAPPEALADAVRKIHDGLRVLDPALAAQSLFEGATPLTERERQVLRLSAGGSPVAAIAREAFLSPGTVRNYLSTSIGRPVPPTVPTPRRSPGRRAGSDRAPPTCKIPLGVSGPRREISEEPMCYPVTCSVCGKTTWDGCGEHIDSVRTQVPPAQWCGGHVTAS